MHRSLVLVLSLALLGCATTPPVQPVLSPAVAPMATPAPSPDLRVASLPARPAGAAFAMAGEEHALVRLPAPASRRQRRCRPWPSRRWRPMCLRCRPPTGAGAKVRRLPGDTALLDRAGGAKLPGAIACTPPSTAAPGQPRALVPALP